MRINVSLEVYASYELTNSMSHMRKYLLKLFEMMISGVANEELLIAWNRINEINAEI
jgi:hypothetical protein